MQYRFSHFIGKIYKPHNARANKDEGKPNSHVNSFISQQMLLSS